MSTLIGRPFSVAEVSAVLALPADFPVLPDAMVAGVRQGTQLIRNPAGPVWERLDVVGLARTMSDEELISFADAPPPGWTKGISARNESGGVSVGFFGGPYRPGGDMFVYARIDRAAEEGRAPVQLRLISKVDALVPPAWIELLAVPAGGTLERAFEAVGSETDGEPGDGSGSVEAEWSFPQESSASVRDWLASSALAEAGFTADEVRSPDPDFTFRNVSVGPWKGTVQWIENGESGSLLWELRQ